MTRYNEKNSFIGEILDYDGLIVIKNSSGIPLQSFCNYYNLDKWVKRNRFTIIENTIYRIR